MHPILLRLADGSPGVVGASAAVADEIADDPGLLAVVVDGLSHTREGVRNRSANALDRATRRRPHLLQPHAAAILDAAQADRSGSTLRRLLPLLLGRLDLDLPNARRAAVAIRRALAEPVANQANAIDALASLALRHPLFASEARRQAEIRLDDPAPSLRSRAHAVLLRLDRAS